MRKITLRCTACLAVRQLESVRDLRRYAEEPVHPPCPRCGGPELPVEQRAAPLRRRP